MQAEELSTNHVSKHNGVYSERYPFETMEQGLRRFAAKSETQCSILDAAGATDNVRERYLNEVVEARIRFELYQTFSDVHCAALAETLYPQGRYLIKEGFDELLKRLQTISGATVKYQTEVTTITKRKGGRAIYSLTTADGQIGDFDAVVLATSQASLPDRNAIVFDGLANPPKNDQVKYQSLYTTVVIGQLNWDHFNHHIRSRRTRFVRPSHRYDYIISTETSMEEALFNSITTVHTLTKNELQGLIKQGGLNDEQINPLETVTVTKVTSHRQLDSSDLNQLFTTVVWFHANEHFRYPILSPRANQDFPHIKLDDRVYYPNAMDAFIDTVEHATLAGDNVAQLIVEDLLSIIGYSSDLENQGH
ncbi:hypothetical protein H4R33_006804 [Dimargaris cristalligena]|nr:hypothetical protein H4R33_006804 [Dimargaris cristalligena]